MILATALTLLCEAAAALQLQPLPPHSVTLLNAADLHVEFPLQGLGMPQGTDAAHAATLSFLALGGRRTDSADSYTGAEPGIGLAMREWMAADPAEHQRSSLFIGSKIGPGGACWPLGYNESIAQANMILGYYNALPSIMPTPNITQLDVLLVHWPTNFGPCSIHGPPGIPTTDPLCNAGLPTYSERGCRISTWRGMVVAWKMGLTRSIGVSNWNSTDMQNLKDAGLPLPAVNQIQWNPGIMAESTDPSSLVPNCNQSFAELRLWCVDHGILVNGYSPFGYGGTASAFKLPAVHAIGANHNVSAAQAILRWQIQLGVAVNPMATNPMYQAENLATFGFNLTAKEMSCMATLDPEICPPPPPPPPPSPAQAKCAFNLAQVTISLKSLPLGPFNLTDRLSDSYLVTSPCSSMYSQHTNAPALEFAPGYAGGIPLGYLSHLTTAALPASMQKEGMRLILSGGSPNPGCGNLRTLWYDMVCDKAATATQGPNATLFISSNIDPMPGCTYRVVWHTAAACAAPSPPMPPPPPPPPRPPATPPLPTLAQLSMMDTGLAQFMHFSVDTWSGIEHNCVPVGSSKCLPTSLFNPSNLSTDQWVEAAVAMGAGEICLTAHHEGGFCLWDTQYTNYSVMNSPYGKDVVEQFVHSCAKYNVKPCFYMGPNSNGWLMQEKADGLTYVEAQLGMLRELLTKYGNGTDYVSRLWWDHYSPCIDSCSGDPNVACPAGSFPDAWILFVQLVRDISPSTIICPGPDCDGHMGEAGMGVYPTWFNCQPNTAPYSPPGPSGTQMTCGLHAPTGANLTGFHPFETCGTLLDSGYFCRPGACGPFWTPRQIWDHYMMSVGVGWVNTLNAPPGGDGRIPVGLVANMASFGDSLRALLRPLANRTAAGVATCSASAAPLVLEFTDAIKLNAVMIREDLSQGQRIAEYAIDFLDSSNTWQTFRNCHGQACLPGFDPHGGATIPSVASGACGVIENNMNLIVSEPPHSGACVNCRLGGSTDNASACEALCHGDKTCNFWTWHDLTNPPPWPKQCYLRNDTMYRPTTQASHVSGVCNHTLAVPNQLGGIHGQSVGSRLIDFVPETVASKIRFRCLKSLAVDGLAYVRSLSVHWSQPP
jgi:alpha-L-fucosidase